MTVRSIKIGQVESARSGLHRTRTTVRRGQRRIHECSSGLEGLRCTTPVDQRSALCERNCLGTTRSSDTTARALKNQNTVTRHRLKLRHEGAGRLAYLCLSVEERAVEPAATSPRRIDGRVSRLTTTEVYCLTVDRSVNPGISYLRIPVRIHLYHRILKVLGRG